MEIKKELNSLITEKFCFYLIILLNVFLESLEH